MKYVRLQHTDVVFFHVPNEGKRTPFERYKNKAVGVVAGVSDFVLAVNGRVLFLEIKVRESVTTNKGRLKTSQIEFQRNAERAGCQAVVAYGFDDARAKIDEFVTLHR